MIEALLFKNACLFTYFVSKLSRFVVRTLKNLLNIGKSCVFPTSSWTAAFPESFDYFKKRRLGVETGSTIPELYWYDRFTGDGEEKNRQSMTGCSSDWIEKRVLFGYIFGPRLNSLAMCPVLRNIDGYAFTHSTPWHSGESLLRRPFATQIVVKTDVAHTTAEQMISHQRLWNVQKWKKHVQSDCFFIVRYAHLWRSCRCLHRGYWRLKQIRSRRQRERHLKI